MRCSVQNCAHSTKKTNKSQGISFHLFPKDPKLRAAWLNSLNAEDYTLNERSMVCSEHFRSEHFYQTKAGMRKVKSGALPVACQDSAEDLDAPAAQKVCRICLGTDGKLFDLAETKLDQLYELFTGIYFALEDREMSIPQRLCWECAHRLRTALAFKDKALRAHSILADLVHTNKIITLRDIKSVNRTYNKLKTNLIQRIQESNEYDLKIQDIKTENQYNNMFNDNATSYNDNGTFDNHNGITDNENEITDNGNRITDSVNGITANGNDTIPFIEVEVKDESTNELYIDEFNHFESDDDKKLSELHNEIVESEKEEKRPKVKRKRVKKKEAKPSEEDYTPTSILDKYKTNEIKRRKNDGPDENLFTITSLTYTEQISEIEKRQDSTMYRNAPYKCSACYRGFQLRERYDAHVLRHSEQSGAFECFICKTRLKTGRALRKHLTAQHTEKFSCKGCPFVTRNRGVAREHEKWHSGTKYQCPHCPSTFEKLTTYMGHIRIKHASDFVCALCGYTFVSQKGIDVHQKKKHRLGTAHLELSGPFCEVCGVKFLSEEAHTRHLKLSSRHSSDNDPNRIRNDSQSMRTEHTGRSVRNIERRPLIHTRDGDVEIAGAGPVTCEQGMMRMRARSHSRPSVLTIFDRIITYQQCGVQLRDLRLYAQHFRRAHPDKNRTKYPAMKTPCMCEQCGRIFQSMALLKDHMWVHTGEKRFKCSHCPKSFTQKTNLVFHERVHSSSRPSYECPLCGKHFAFFNNRRRHMFIHTGLKPYKCDTCGKCFTTAGEQRAHVDHVHLKKPWPRRARRQGGEMGGDLGGEGDQ